MNEIERVVQSQVDAYNNRDINAFLATYSQDAVLRRLDGGALIADGEIAIRKIYVELFNNSPELKCCIVQRMLKEPFVIDLEEVSGINGEENRTRAIAVYRVVKNKIAEVYFI